MKVPESAVMVSRNFLHIGSGATGTTYDDRFSSFAVLTLLSHRQTQPTFSVFQLDQSAGYAPVGPS